MKTATAIKTVKQKQISNTLISNKGALDVNIECLLDGRQVYKEKGHSLVGNFASVLAKMFMFGEPNVVRLANPAGTGDQRTITGISDAGGDYSGKVKITCSGGTSFSSATTYVICHGTGYAGLDDLQIACVYVNATNVVVPTVNYVATGTGTLDGIHQYSTTTQTIDDAPLIVVGLADGAVTINDAWLYNQDTGLSASTQTSAVQTGTYPSYTRLTRIFTNNTVAAITIKEVGLSGRITSPSNARGLIARDVLSSSITIDPSTSLTINYDVSIALDAGTDPGGWLLNFSAVLNSLLRYTNRSVTDIGNIARTININDYGMAARTFGGENSAASGYVAHANAGVIVGTGDTATAGAEYILETKCDNGAGAGQLIHYGTIVEQVVWGAGYAQFDIIRLFENRSGNTITIKETGLAGLVHGSSGAQMNYSALIARNVLTTPVAVDDGEALKVTYTVKVEI